jgi:arginine deiminase
MGQMKDLWTGRVELLTPPSESGDTRCFTNIFVWAESPEDFAAAIAHHLGMESISVIQIQESHHVTENEEFPEETTPFLEWVKIHPGDLTTADRHYYPSKPA